MLFIIRPFHKFCKRYDVKHHHVLIVWSLLSIAIPVTAVVAAVGATFSNIAQAFSLTVLGLSLGIFFYILLEAEEKRIDSQRNKVKKPR